jgi:hypothetical protein
LCCSKVVQQQPQEIPASQENPAPQDQASPNANGNVEVTVNVPAAADAPPQAAADAPPAAAADAASDAASGGPPGPQPEQSAVWTETPTISVQILLHLKRLLLMTKYVS